jgi:hypothetical protein
LAAKTYRLEQIGDLIPTLIDSQIATPTTIPIQYLGPQRRQVLKSSQFHRVKPAGFRRSNFCSMSRRNLPKNTR